MQCALSLVQREQVRGTPSFSALQARTFTPGIGYRIRICSARAGPPGVDGRRSLARDLVGYAGSARLTCQSDALSLPRSATTVSLALSSVSAISTSACEDGECDWKTNGTRWSMDSRKAGVRM